MAIVRVWSGGDDTDGSTWVKAVQSFNDAKVQGVVAGSEIWVADDHDETFPSVASLILDFSLGSYIAPIIISSRSRSDNSYSPSGRFGIDGSSHTLTIRGNLRSYGVDYRTVTPALNLEFNEAAVEKQYYEDCTMTSARVLQVGFPETFTQFNNVILDLNKSTTFAFSLSVSPSADGANVLFRDCTFLTTVGGANLVDMGDGCRLVLESCDLTPYDFILSNRDQGNLDIVLRRCQMKAGWGMSDVAIIEPGQHILAEGCTSDTGLSVPELGLTRTLDYYGTVQGDLTRRRTGGADDGENVNEYSWEMVASANALEMIGILESPPVTVWVDPDTSPSGATSQGIFTSKRMAFAGSQFEWDANHLTTQTDIAASSTGDKLTSSTSSKFDVFNAGQRVTVSGFTEAANNGVFYIDSVTTGGSPEMALLDEDGSSAANLTTEAAGDSITITPWVGSGVGVPQKIEHTLSNQNAATLVVYFASAVAQEDDEVWIEINEPDQVGGPVTVRFFVANDGTPVYFDLKLEIT